MHALFFIRGKTSTLHSVAIGGLLLRHTYIFFVREALANSSFHANVVQRCRGYVTLVFYHWQLSVTKYFSWVVRGRTSTTLMSTRLIRHVVRKNTEWQQLLRDEKRVYSIWEGFTVFARDVPRITQACSTCIRKTVKVEVSSSDQSGTPKYQPGPKEPSRENNP